jgi:hypothetical protein
MVGWRQVTPRQWQLVNERGQLLHTVTARGPYLNESRGLRYIVSGDGYSSTTHNSLREAQAAAMQSADGKRQLSARRAASEQPR